MLLCAMLLLLRLLELLRTGVLSEGIRASAGLLYGWICWSAGRGGAWPGRCCCWCAAVAAMARGVCAAI